MNNHPFDRSEVADLVFAMNSPVMVLKSRTNGGKVLLLDIKHGNKNFIAAVSLNSNIRSNSAIQINKITGLYPKDSYLGILRSMESGEAEYVNENKTLQWLTQQLSDTTDLDNQQRLISVANLVRNYYRGKNFGGNLQNQDADSQYLQSGDSKSAIYTDNFKKWFGDWENDPENASKVVDENGEPMVMYHGSSVKAKDINVFDMLDGSMGKGAYFTSSYEEACNYAKEALAGTEGFPKNAEDISDEDVEQYVGEYYLNVRDSKNITHSRFDRDAIEVIATSAQLVEHKKVRFRDLAFLLRPHYHRFSKNGKSQNFSDFQKAICSYVKKQFVFATFIQERR